MREGENSWGGVWGGEKDDRGAKKWFWNDMDPEGVEGEKCLGAGDGEGGGNTLDYVCLPVQKGNCAAIRRGTSFIFVGRYAARLGVFAFLGAGAPTT